LHQRLYGGGIGGRPASIRHGPVEIGHSPRLAGLLRGVAWDQVLMQVASPLPEGDGIDPFTPRELAHEARGSLNRPAPGCGLSRGEIDRAAQMARRIEEQPARQGRRIRMMAQQPEVVAADLPALPGIGIAVKTADPAGRGSAFAPGLNNRYCCWAPWEESI